MRTEFGPSHSWFEHVAPRTGGAWTYVPIHRYALTDEPHRRHFIAAHVHEVAERAWVEYGAGDQHGRLHFHYERTDDPNVLHLYVAMLPARERQRVQ